MKATIVQMMLASALTLFLLVGIIGPLRLLSFLISYNASDAPFAGTWFNFGYFTYLIGVLAIGMIAMIYRYFEHTLRPSNVADVLEEEYLIRKEERGAQWYGLTNDRLIKPIEDSNKKWEIRKVEKERDKKS